MRQVNASTHKLNAVKKAKSTTGTLMTTYAIDRQPVRSRRADCSHPKKPGRGAKGAGSSMSSATRLRAKPRWIPPMPRAPRTERPMMARPKKVTANTAPDGHRDHDESEPDEGQHAADHQEPQL